MLARVLLYTSGRRVLNMSIDTLYRNYDSGSSDPWSNYGLPGGDPSSGSSNSYYSNYEQQLLSYIQSLKTQLSTLQAGSPDYETAIQYLNTAMGYLQQVDPQMASDPSAMGGGAWDPMSGGYGTGSSPYPSSNPLDPNSTSTSSTDPNAVAGVSGSTQTPTNSFPISYQDSSHIVTDEGDTTSITLDENDPETRTIDVYQKGNTLIVPSNSANVNVQAQADDAVAGATMFVVTYTCNGKTRTVKYHNVDREDFKLDIQTPDKTQVTMDASLSSSQFASKVTNESSSDLANMQGTPPDETTATTRTWDKNSTVDYYVTEGSEKDEIYGDQVSISLPDRTDTAEVTRVDGPTKGLPPFVYEITVKDSTGKVIRTIEVNQASNIDFKNISPANLSYEDKSSKGESNAKFKTWNDPDCQQDSVITVNGQAGGAIAGPLNPNAPSDSVPSSVDGKTAIYNKDKDVTVTAYPDDNVYEHDITANGKVTINPNNQEDTADVSYDAGPPAMLTITIQTTDKNGNPAKPEVFKVNASMADKITLNVDTSNITYENGIPTDIQKKIFDANGTTASDAVAKNTLAQNSSIQNLMSTYNVTEDQISAAMTKAGLTADDFTTPLSASPDVVTKMINFMTILDPGLGKELENTSVLDPNDPTNADSIRKATQDVQKDLEKLGYGQGKNPDLFTWDKGKFPAQIFYTDAQTAGLMSIGGHIFSLFDSSGLNITKWQCVDITQPNLAIDPNTGQPIAPPEGGSTAWIFWDAQLGEWIGDGNQQYATEYSQGNYDNYGNGLPLNLPDDAPTDPTSTAADTGSQSNYLTGNDWPESDQNNWGGKYGSR
jgi:hypothetical protein